MSGKTLLTTEMHEELREALSSGMTVTECCDLVGISRPTFYTWVRRGVAGEAPFSALVLDLRRSWAQGTRWLLGLAKDQAVRDPSQVRYLLGIRNPRAYGREPEGRDFVAEALDGSDRDDQVALMAGHPDVRAAVLASLTSEEIAEAAQVVPALGRLPEDAE